VRRDELNGDLLTVFTTAPDAEVGERLAGALVAERLAACGSVVPGVVSIYRWQDEVRRDAEVLVMLKTTEERFEALRARAVALHPYEVPELIALPVCDAHGPYRDWVRAEVG